MADPHTEADGFAGIEWLPKIVASFPRPLAHTYRNIVLDPTDPGNRSMLVRYALEMLPEKLRRVSVAQQIADRSRGVFLYAFHLVQALRSGAFASADDLPAAELFYGAHLGRLRERVGDAL